MEARPMLEAIVNAQAEPAAGASRSSAALRLAITAEAQAMLAHWDEAEKLYRQAIDEIEDDTIKRSWWFNLAHVAVQLNDDTQRKAALQAALETFYTDDISRRALELQRVTESGGRLRSNGTKAN